MNNDDDKINYLIFHVVKKTLIFYRTETDFSLQLQL